MNKSADIVCKELTIEFPLFDRVSRSLRARMIGQAGKNQNFRALDQVSVTIKNGERVGLLGRNGAGKSTFLRTLAGVYPPVSGSIKIGVPTTSFFEVSVGTDNDASGYENIPLLMASRGIARKYYNDVVQDVEDFTELGSALFRPLRTYSSGMRLRIAFAVATYQANGILLLDEILGVGDPQFAEKSKKRIIDLMSNAGSLVLASHSPTLLRTHCKRGLVFEDGKIVFDGSIEECLNMAK